MHIFTCLHILKIRHVRFKIVHNCFRQVRFKIIDVGSLKMWVFLSGKGNNILFRYITFGNRYDLSLMLYCFLYWVVSFMGYAIIPDTVKEKYDEYSTAVNYSDRKAEIKSWLLISIFVAVLHVVPSILI